MDSYTKINSKVFDQWNKDGWEWGMPISHEQFVNATRGSWNVVLTPTKYVPHHWFGNLCGAKVLGLACGGGQQMPIFTAVGAKCTVLDYSQSQLESERMVAEREGYDIDIVCADMSKALPFADNSFDMIFHPVSNCYILDVQSVWKECYRVLRKGGILLSGLDNGINFVYDDDQQVIRYKLPFNPLQDKELYELSIKEDWGIQFSHTIEEQIGGQLQAGFRLVDIYSDTNGGGNLHDYNIATFYATKSIKE